MRKFDRQLQFWCGSPYSCQGMERPQHHSIDRLKERVEKVRNDLCSTRQTLVLSPGQPYTVRARAAER